MRDTRYHNAVHLLFEPSEYRRLLLGFAGSEVHYRHKLDQYIPALIRHCLTEPVRYRAFDTVIIGSNPILNALAALDAVRSGQSVLINNHSVDAAPDVWPYELCLAPAAQNWFTGLVGRAPVPAALTNPFTPDLSEIRQQGQATVWFAPFFRSIISRISSGNACSAEVPLDLKLIAHTDTLGLLSLGSTARPLTGESDSIASQAMRQWSELCRSLPALRTSKPDRPFSRIIASRILVTSPIENFTAGTNGTGDGHDNCAEWPGYRYIGLSAGGAETGRQLIEQAISGLLELSPRQYAGP